MTNQNRRLAIVCLLCLSLVNFVNLDKGQAVSQEKPSSRNPGAIAAKRAIRLRPEEKLIRLAYEKLSVYHTAALQEASRDVVPPNENLNVKFELRDFRTG